MDRVHKLGDSEISRSSSQLSSVYNKALRALGENVNARTNALVARNMFCRWMNLV
jgi:hypothetical protein